MDKNKFLNKIKNLPGLISALAFVVLLVTSIVLYGVLGFFALVTRIFYIATAVSFIALAVFNWEIIRSFFKRRTNTVGIYKAVQFIVILGVLVFMYLLADTLSWKLDFTSSRLYSFSDQTKEILDGVTNDMDIILFKPGAYSAQPLVQYQENLLVAYSDRNPLINLEVVDPQLNPSRAIEYDVEEAGAAVFEYQGNRVKILFDEIYEMDSTSGDFTYRGEIAYTAAIKGLLDSQAKKAYIITGHGEINWADDDLYGFSSLVSLIESDRIDVYSLNLLSQPFVPEDCGVMIIANPLSTIAADELDMINNYLVDGGSVLLLLEFNADITVNEMLRNMGLFFLPNMVYDNERYLVRSGTTYLVPNIQPYPDITNPLLWNNYSILMPTGSYIERLDNDLRPDGYTYFISPLLLSSVNSYAEMSDDEIGTTSSMEDDADIEGPVTLAYASKRVKYLFITNDDSVETNIIESRLVAIGDTTFVNNMYIDQYGNSDFFLNAVNFLLKRDAEITTRPKEAGVESYVLTSLAKRVMNIVSIMIVVIYLGVGIYIITKRRSTVKEKSDKK